MRKIIPFLLTAFFLYACAQWPQPVVTVVNEIAVTYEQEGYLIQKCYTNSDKIHQILNELRQLGQRTTPSTDPDLLPGRGSSITLNRSDGSQQIWRTKADRFICRAPEPWQQADPQRIESLENLIRSLPSDRPETIVPILSKSG